MQGRLARAMRLIFEIAFPGDPAVYEARVAPVVSAPDVVCCARRRWLMCMAEVARGRLCWVACAGALVSIVSCWRDSRQPAPLCVATNGASARRHT